VGAQIASAAAAAMGVTERQRIDPSLQGQMGGIVTASFDDL